MKVEAVLCSLIYVDRVVQQDLLYENHKCPCVASAKCLCPKTKIYAFSFEKHKGVNVLSFMYSNYLYSPSWKSDFVELFGKGFGNIQEEKMFLSLCNVECIYFLMVF